MDSVLIDSDVILDVFLLRKPFHDSSGAILDLCDRKKIHGFLTPIIISNVYYILTKDSTSLRSRNKINEILKFIETIDVPKKVILAALKSPFKDFEDALQNYAAIENGKITTIITRNVKDYKHSLLKVMTPKEYLA